MTSTRNIPAQDMELFQTYSDAHARLIELQEDPLTPFMQRFEQALVAKRAWRAFLDAVEAWPRSTDAVQ